MGRSHRRAAPTPRARGCGGGCSTEDSGEQRLRPPEGRGRRGRRVGSSPRARCAGRGGGRGVHRPRRDGRDRGVQASGGGARAHPPCPPVENLDVVVWACDASGVFTYYDGKALAAAGMKPGQLVGLNNFDICNEHQTGGLRRALRGEPMRNVVEAEGRPTENWFVPVRGEAARWTRWSASPRSHRGTARGGGELRERPATHRAGSSRSSASSRRPSARSGGRAGGSRLIGVVDSARTAEVMDSLLQAVVRTRGPLCAAGPDRVEAVDTTAASTSPSSSARSGSSARRASSPIRPSVAQTIVSLGIDLAEITTLSDLQAGLSDCIGRTLREATRGGRPDPG